MTFTLKTPDAPMSFKQGITIRNLKGGDVREEGLTMQQASDRIAKLMAAKGKTPKASTFDYANLLARANDAGWNAGAGSTPTPMTVEGMGETWHVAEGACGFAWVNFKMKSGLGRKFGQWLIKSGNARKDSYLGGCTIWISEHGQSIDRKSAHAAAMANVLQEAGIADAYASSRMD